MSRPTDSRCLPNPLPFSALLVLAAITASPAHAQFAQARKVGLTNDCSYSTIQAAINASASGDTIQIQGGTTYTEHLTITNKSLALGTGLCTPIIGRPGEASPQPSAPALVTISGSGGANTAVLSISGVASVTLNNLLIRNGHSSGGGGGIAYNAAGALTLNNVTLTQNAAAAGGGVDFNGTTAGATLTIGADTVISNNTVTGSGGGIRLRGNSSMLMDAPSVIAVNHADGEGGGLQVISPAKADIGSPGLPFAAAFALNEANNGGAIAIYYNTGETPLVRLYTTDPLNPVRLQSNTATNVGGGIYLHSNNDDLRYGSLAMFDTRFVDNSARNGAAWFQDDYNYFGPGVYATSFVTFNVSYFAGPPPQAVRCAVGVACNDLTGNATIDINGNPVPGAIVYVSAGGWMQASRMRVRENSAAQFIAVDDDNDATYVFLGTSLIADNVLSDTLIRKNRTTFVFLTQSTISHNEIGGNALMVGDVGGLSIYHSIIDQPGKTVYSGGGDLTADYVLTQDPAMTGYGTHLFYATPAFIDADNGNYRLAVTRRGSTVTGSAGIDVIAAVTGDDRDLDFLPFDQDVSVILNIDGVRDLGAFEAQPISRIFADGFGDAVPMVN